MAAGADDLRHLEEPVAGPSDRTSYPPTTSAIVSGGNNDSNGNGNGSGGGPRRERSESGSAGSRGSVSGPTGPSDQVAGPSSAQVPPNGKQGYGVKKRGKEDDGEEKKPKKTRQTREYCSLMVSLGCVDIDHDNNIGVWALLFNVDSG